MAEGHERAGGPHPGGGERDVVSELRPRGAEPPPPGLAGRVESAEGAVRALEERLGAILRRIDDSEEQRRRAMDRLADSERQVQLERSARERAERMLASMRSAQRRVSLAVADLRELTARLRAIAEREAPAPDPAASTPAGAPPLASAPSEPAPAGAAAEPALAREVEEEEEERRRQMADALAAAITRLRERVAAVGESHAQRLAEEERSAETPEGEIHEGEPGQPITAAASELPVAHETPAQPPSRQPPRPATGTQPVEVLPRVLGARPEGADWLADAIVAVARNRDPKMAAELIAELLPAQRLKGDRAMAYQVKIAEIGSFDVRIVEGRATVTRSQSTGFAAGEADFVLEGPAESFARLVAGGDRRALRGLTVRGSRRLSRRLAGSSRKPLSLADLVELGIDVWPGLLLLALAESIEPALTAGHRFAVDFAIKGHSSATVRVDVRDGQPVLISRARGGEPPAALTVHVSERGFICLLAGMQLSPDERITVEGDVSALVQLLSFTDRAQGLGSSR